MGSWKGARKNMVFNKHEDAVSPVIGTILMVAITVILAAVIGAFVFGVPTNIQKAKLMGSSIQVDTNGGTVLLSYHGGPDDISLDKITITAPNGTAMVYQQHRWCPDYQYSIYTGSCQTESWRSDEIKPGSRLASGKKTGPCRWSF